MPTHDLEAVRKANAHKVIQQVFEADRHLDTEAFLRLLSPEVVLRIGSQPCVVGVDAVRRVIAGMFAGMRDGIHHTLVQSWTASDDEGGVSLAYQADAVFHLLDGRDVALPYVNILRIVRSGLVSTYSIYIDPAPLRAVQG